MTLICPMLMRGCCYVCDSKCQLCGRLRNLAHTVCYIFACLPSFPWGDMRTSLPVIREMCEMSPLITSVGTYPDAYRSLSLPLDEESSQISLPTFPEMVLVPGTRHLSASMNDLARFKRGVPIFACNASLPPQTADIQSRGPVPDRLALSWTAHVTPFCSLVCVFGFVGSVPACRGNCVSMSSCWV